MTLYVRVETMAWQNIFTTVLNVTQVSLFHALAISDVTIIKLTERPEWKHSALKSWQKMRGIERLTSEFWIVEPLQERKNASSIQEEFT